MDSAPGRITFELPYRMGKYSLKNDVVEARSSGARWTPLAGAAFVALAFAALAASSWMRWPDVIVDYGRELYIAWRLSQGEHLHRDIAYFSGAFSPYFNAAVFHAFGVGLHTLVYANLTIVAAFTALLYRMATRIAGPVSAAVGSVLFLTLSGFAQLIQGGGYNWAAPYSHDMTHGVLFATASLAAIWRFERGGGRAWLAASGVLVGLAFLTRPELFLAAALAVGLHLALGAWCERRTGAQIARDALLLTGSALVVPVIAFILLACTVDIPSAWLDIQGTWPTTLAGQVARLPNFQRSFGIAPYPNAQIRLVRSCGVYALVALVLLYFVFRRTTPYWRTLSSGSAGLVLAMMWLARGGSISSSPYITRALPVFLGVLILGLARELTRRRRDGSATARDVERLSFSVLALALIAKILFFTRFEHYGAFCTNHGLVTITITLFVWLPALLERRGGTGRACQAFFAPFFVVLWILAMKSFLTYHGPRTLADRPAGKSTLIGDPPDAFVADYRGRPLSRALSWLKSHVLPDETFVVLPEGVMLNFLARCRSSVPHTNFMPTEMLIFGEEEILKTLEDNPPDYIVLVAKNTREYGPKWFGVHYAKRIRAWVDAHCHEVHVIWYRPFIVDKYGVQILSRKRISPRRRRDRGPGEVPPVELAPPSITTPI